jgi:hypothetical protein
LKVKCLHPAQRWLSLCRYKSFACCTVSLRISAPLGGTRSKARPLEFVSSWAARLLACCMRFQRESMSHSAPSFVLKGLPHHMHPLKQLSRQYVHASLLLSLCSIL